MTDAAVKAVKVSRWLEHYVAYVEKLKKPAIEDSGPQRLGFQKVRSIAGRTFPRMHHQRLYASLVLLGDDLTSQAVDVRVSWQTLGLLLALNVATVKSVARDLERLQLLTRSDLNVVDEFSGVIHQALATMDLGLLDHEPLIKRSLLTDPALRKQSVLRAMDAFFLQGTMETFSLDAASFIVSMMDAESALTAERSEVIRGSVASLGSRLHRHGWQATRTGLEWMFSTRKTEWRDKLRTSPEAGKYLLEVMGVVVRAAGLAQKRNAFAPWSKPLTAAELAERRVVLGY